MIAKEVQFYRSHSEDHPITQDDCGQNDKAEGVNRNS